jgi:endogenous inhibitor of DNA gyrase (YacG/DUF329 family)
MICETCGAQFDTKRLHGRYCSEACKQRAKRNREKTPKRHALRTVTKKRLVVICANCGADFKATSPRARYCSGACKQAAYRVRNGL